MWQLGVFLVASFRFHFSPLTKILLVKKGVENLIDKENGENAGQTNDRLFRLAELADRIYNAETIEEYDKAIEKLKNLKVR